MEAKMLPRTVTSKRTTPKQQLKELAREKHWGIRELGPKEVPEISVFDNGWWNVPAGTESITYSTAAQRLKEIQEAGIPITGYYIRHETTHLLPPPKKEVEARAEEARQRTQKVLQAFGAVGLVVGTVVVAGTVAVGLGTIAVAALVAAAVDPAVVVILPSGEAIEVARWAD
jgi:hypothetical protein